jgi:type IV pilus assembly protein PilO
MALPAAFEPIALAPRWQKVLLGLMGLAGLLAAAWLGLLSPAQTQIDTLRSRSDALRRELAQARRDVAELARVRKEVAELEARIQAIKEKLPTEKEMPGLFRSVSEAAFQSGLAVALFQPREPKVSDYYSEVPITLSGEGGYHQVGEFVERLAGLPRVVNLVEWKLGGLDKNPRPLRAELTLATYIYRPVGSPPAPKAPGAPKAASPRAQLRQ